jgi:rare lipoprotein A
MMPKAARGSGMAALLLSGTLLSGCAEVNLFGHFAKKAVSDSNPPPPVTSTVSPNYKVGKPYQVAGVWYYPQEDFDYDQTGIASWYGPDFHGKLTGNGELFDQNAISAAHKTLPMPCVVRVTNLENGRSVVVRVNDRGPFVNGRIIDMSRRGAQMLGFESQGTARVRVQVLAEESRVLAGRLKSDAPGEPRVAAAPRESVTAETLPPPGSREAPKPVKAVAAAPQRGVGIDAVERQLTAAEVKTVPVHATNLFIQAGSFARHDNALRLQARLSVVGKPQISQVNLQGKIVYRVRLGPVGSIDEADRLLDAVIAAGQQDARVVVD